MKTGFFFPGMLILFWATACGGDGGYGTQSTHNGQVSEEQPYHDGIMVVDEHTVPIEDIVVRKPIEPPAPSIPPVQEPPPPVAFEDIDDELEDDEDFDPKGLESIENSPAHERLISLMNDPDYQRKNGKLKRNKIKQQLNKEGYRKPDGEKFSRRDIPNSPE